MTKDAPTIIDIHCHAGTRNGRHGVEDIDTLFKRYLTRAEASGVGHTVVFPIFHEDYRVANRDVASIVRRHPGLLSGFAMVHPSRDRGRVGALVDEAIECFGFCGIKVHRHDARLTREVCEVASTRGIPVLYDPMGEIWPLEAAAAAYPSLPIVVPHLGSYVDDWRAQLSVIGLLRARSNIYVDTSAVREFDILRLASSTASDRLVFGSDGPWLHPRVELTKVQLLGLHPDKERMVLGGTALSLLSRSPFVPAPDDASSPWDELDPRQVLGVPGSIDAREDTDSECDLTWRRGSGVKHEAP